MDLRVFGASSRPFRQTSVNAQIGNGNKGTSSAVMAGVAETHQLPVVGSPSQGYPMQPFNNAGFAPQSYYENMNHAGYAQPAPGVFFSERVPTSVAVQYEQEWFAKLRYLQDEKGRFKKKQLKGVILMPACRPDEFELELKFKQFFEARWGEWGSDYHHPFDPAGQLEREFLQSCMLLQWRLKTSGGSSDEDSDRYYDRGPIIVYTKSSEQNKQRKESPSLQACLLGVDPALFDKLLFEAQIKLVGSDVAKHNLEPMSQEGKDFDNRQNILTQRPVKFDNSKNQSADPANPQFAPAAENMLLSSKKRKIMPAPSRTKTTLQPKHLWIACIQQTTSKKDGSFCYFDDKEMRGCLRQYDDEEERMKHCIAAHFDNLGFSKYEDRKKQPTKQSRSVIEVQAELHFKGFQNPVCVIEETNPFLVSPGKDKLKDSGLFRDFALQIILGKFDCDLKKARFTWGELRDFFKVIFKVFDLNIRELDKMELLLLQCKLLLPMRPPIPSFAFSSLLLPTAGSPFPQNVPDALTNGGLASVQNTSATLEERRLLLLNDFVELDRLITYDDLVNPDRTLSVINPAVQTGKSFWEWIGDAYTVLMNNRRHGSDETSKLNKLFPPTKEYQRKKMIDLFNERIITMTPRAFANAQFRKIGKRCSEQKMVRSEGNRILMVRFEDDFASLCCVTYMNPEDYTNEPWQSCTSFREINIMEGGFYNFFSYPFSRKYTRIIQLARHRERRAALPSAEIPHHIPNSVSTDADVMGFTYSQIPVTDNGFSTMIRMEISPEAPLSSMLNHLRVPPDATNSDYPSNTSTAARGTPRDAFIDMDQLPPLSPSVVAFSPSVQGGSVEEDIRQSQMASIDHYSMRQLPIFDEKSQDGSKIMVGVFGAYKDQEKDKSAFERYQRAKHGCERDPKTGQPMTPVDVRKVSVQDETSTILSKLSLSENSEAQHH